MCDKRPRFCAIQGRVMYIYISQFGHHWLSWLFHVKPLHETMWAHRIMNLNIKSPENRSNCTLCSFGIIHLKLHFRQDIFYKDVIMMDFLYSSIPLPDNKIPGIRCQPCVNVLDRCQTDVNARVSASRAKPKRGSFVHREPNQFVSITVILITIIILYPSSSLHSCQRIWY